MKDQNSEPVDNANGHTEANPVFSGGIPEKSGGASTSHWKARIRRTLLCVLVMVFVFGCLWRFRSAPSDSASDTPPREEYPVPELSSSPFLNTQPHARYIGSQACQTCHQDEYASYMKTGMAAAMSKVTAADNWPEITFDHPPSGRRYEIHASDAQLWHREILSGTKSNSNNIVLQDHPIKYVVGSGTHFSIFLTEADGFLLESPATWYAHKPGWDMSPGYDQPRHQGFERAVTVKCLFCHAGQVEAVDGSYHRFRIQELGIGCERCHGPGSLHVERWSGDAPALSKTDIDHTIVNPAHLDRECAESVCQQCHLTTTAYVEARERRISDYRPGLPLSDFRHFYQLHGQKKSMQVVGHVEQQLLSRCYQESDSLSCITCHNPHDTPEPEARIDYYRSICLNCHSKQSCTVEPVVLSQQSPQNDCVQCHMPSVSTKTLHVAVTDHRIGIHSETNEKQPPLALVKEEVGTLEPLHDLTHLSEIDRLRSLGLAYLNLVFHRKPGPLNDVYWNRSLSLLSSVRKQGLREGDVDGTLAQLYWGTDQLEAVICAQNALKDPTLPIEGRLNALFALASYHFEQQRVPEAISAIRELTRLRRHSADWVLLGDCEVLRGDRAAAIKAFAMAVTIQPNMVPVHEQLALLYRQAGDSSNADRHQEIARRIKAVVERARREHEIPNQ